MNPFHYHYDDEQAQLRHTEREFITRSLAIRDSRLARVQIQA